MATREHIANMLRELQPIVNRPEIANTSPESIVSLLSTGGAGLHAASVRRQHQETNNSQAEDAIIINMMDSIDQNESGGNIPAGIQPDDDEQPNRSRRETIQENITSQAESLRNNPELRSLLSVAEKYIGIALVMLFKVIFDHKIGNDNRKFTVYGHCLCLSNTYFFTGILVILGLAITFFHANSTMKREVAKQVCSFG